MKYRPMPMIGAAFAAALCCLCPQAASAQQVEVITPLGTIVMQLRPQDAPESVWNFLRYIGDGDYVDSFVHRSARKGDSGVDVIQGGAFTFTDEDGVVAVPTDPPVINEPGVSNLRGTVAMARSSGVNSATSQWYINLHDDNSVLDTNNEGFTVFADVIIGMDVADAIGGLERFNLGGPFNTLPVTDAYFAEYEAYLIELETDPLAQPPPVNPEDVIKTAFRVIGDTNGDGVIDNGDLAATISGFTGPLPPLAAPVPEPTSLVLLSAGAAMFIRRRR